jgi:hypothetical protein
LKNYRKSSCKATNLGKAFMKKIKAKAHIKIIAKALAKQQI